MFFSVKCYQCAYSPGKTEYKEVHEPVKVADPHNPYKTITKYQVKKVSPLAVWYILQIQDSPFPIYQIYLLHNSEAA